MLFLLQTPYYRLHIETDRSCVARCEELCEDREVARSLSCRCALIFWGCEGDDLIAVVLVVLGIFHALPWGAELDLCFRFGAPRSSQPCGTRVLPWPSRPRSCEPTERLGCSRKVSVEVLKAKEAWARSHII